MINVDKILKSDHIFTMAGEGVGYLENKAIIINNGEIMDIIDKNESDKKYSAEIIDLKDHALFPGFIDGHMHTALAIMRGLAQDTNNWMMYGLQPFDNVLTEEAKNIGSKLGIIEGIKAGTTTFGDFELNMEAVAQFIGEIGARGNLAYTVREAKRKVYKPGELYEFDSKMGIESFEKNLELYDKYHDSFNGRIKFLLGPQGCDFVSEDLLLEIRKQAKKRNTKIHMHVQQGDRETYQIEKRYGKRPIDYLESIGFLDETLIAVHLTDANKEEAEKVAKSGASMLVCPGSIGIIDGIVCPSVEFQNSGGNVGLGSDQAPGNNSHNIINEMKLIALFNKIKYENPEVMPAWKALRMATIEGAKAIGLGDSIGSLEIGKRADIIGIDLNSINMLPVFTHPMRNIVPNLVYSARGNEVSISIVDGEVIYKDGILLKVNEEQIIKDIKNYPDQIGIKAKKEFDEIAGTNFQFMNENKL